MKILSLQIESAYYSFIGSMWLSNHLLFLIAVVETWLPKWKKSLQIYQKNMNDLC